MHVGGEHEDFCDSDFYIYNDVIVERPDGQVDFYLYPRELFPPTDFHTATLIGEAIYLVGALGYRFERGAAIQVTRLDTRDFHVETVETSGEVPGWISRHRAERIGETGLLIFGGAIFTRDNTCDPNDDLFELDLATRRWRRRDHGDITLFPVLRQAYDAGKSPRFGASNPEKVENPFWLEMARRRWLPSRARMHYGDVVRVECAKVWTAVRAEVATVDLADGRRLRIGGRVEDCIDGFHDEKADVWTYSDVLVRPGHAALA